MTALQLSRALIAIAAAALCLGAGWGINRLVDSPAAVRPDSQKLMQDGYATFETGDFKVSKVQFEKAVGLFPENGEAWFMLGLLNHYDKQYDKAQDCFKKSIQYEYRPGLSHFNIACGMALTGKRREAIYELNLAVETGLTLRSHYATDPDLTSLHDDPEFKQLLASLQHPLMQYPEAVAMERRIGSWDVFNRDQRYLGTLRSTMTLSGYGIEEYLVGSSGLSEQSLFLFNRKSKTWVCTHGDGKGEIVELTGKVEGDQIEFTGKKSGAAEGMERITIEFLPEGLIREIHEQAAGEGQPFAQVDILTLKPYQG